MNGRVRLKSVPDVGSTFSFCIPLLAAPQTEAPPTERPLEGVRVLVADRLAESRGCLADALLAGGAEVVEAPPEEAAALAAMHAEGQGGGRAFHAVIVDETADPTPFLALAEPPALLPLSAGGNGPCCGPHAEQWAAQGRPGLAKPMRWSAIAITVAEAVGRSVEAVSLRHAKEPRAGKVAGGHIILVVDDNHTNRIVISAQLKHLGVAFDLAEDGEVAWEALAKKPYALLLTDCQMPNLDGYGLSQRIRAAEADSSKHLPIVALTASVLAGDAEKCLAAGMDDFLAKPTTLEALDAVLCRWLEQAPRAPAAPTNAPTAAVTADPGPRPVDTQALAELLGDDSPETLAAVCDAFLEFFPELLETARQALAVRDRGTLHDKSHAAKGAARSICAGRLATILAELETCSQSRTSFQRLGQMLDDAETAYGEVAAFIGQRTSVT